MAISVMIGIIIMVVIINRCEVSPDLRTTEKGDMEADLVSSATFPGIDFFPGGGLSFVMRCSPKSPRHETALRWEACLAK